MQTLQSLQRQIKSTEDLRSVVRTMKVLAAVNIRQFQRAVESLADYRRTIDMGLQIVLKSRPEILAGLREPPGTRVGAIVFGSDQGMAGQFNEQIADFVVRTLDELPGSPGEHRILAMGDRVVPRLEGRGRPARSQLSLPNSLSMTVPVLQQVVVRIEQWRARDAVSRVLLFSHEPVSGSSYRPHMVQLVPLDVGWLRSLAEAAWPSRSIPTYTMDWYPLFTSLVRQFFFAALYRASVESLASENAARLAAMQVAERNIDERLDQIKGDYNHLRQTSITAELLDIISGFEALVSSKPAHVQ
jgi:F-type H+-transporting ATPase subunit gamma